MQSSLVLINNLAARIRLAPEAFKAGSKVWDGWGRSIEDAWYAIPNQRVAQSRAKRAFLATRTQNSVKLFPTIFSVTSYQMKGLLGL